MTNRFARQNGASNGTADEPVAAEPVRERASVAVQMLCRQFIALQGMQARDMERAAADADNKPLGAGWQLDVQNAEWIRAPRAPRASRATTNATPSTRPRRARTPRQATPAPTETPTA